MFEQFGEQLSSSDAINHKQAPSYGSLYDKLRRSTRVPIRNPGYV